MLANLLLHFSFIHELAIYKLVKKGGTWPGCVHYFCAFSLAIEGEGTAFFSLKISEVRNSLLITNLYLLENFRVNTFTLKFSNIAFYFDISLLLLDLRPCPSNNAYIIYIYGEGNSS